MDNMFYNCKSLTSINISNFDTQNVESFYHMFRNCTSLTSIDLSNFNTQKVEFYDEMFYYCENLVYIDISNFIFREDNNSLFKNLPNKGIIKMNKDYIDKISEIPPEWTII